MITSLTEVSDDDRKQFWDLGYWISPVLIDADRVERLQQALERIFSLDFDGNGYTMYGNWHPGDDPFQLKKLDNAWFVNDIVRETVTDQAIGRIAASLIGAKEVRLWHDQVISKPGIECRESDSGNVGWHQDLGHWQCTANANMITVWIALQDTDETNGAMMMVPGSHKWGLVPGSNTFGEKNLGALKQKFSNQGREWVEDPVVLRKGQASFHHPLTFHGSGANRSSAPRMSVVMHLMAPETVYRPRVQWHPNIAYLGPRPYAGQRFEGDYFPVVYSESGQPGGTSRREME